MIPNGISKLGRKIQDTHPDEGLFCHIQVALAFYSIFVHTEFDQDTWEHQLYVDTFYLSLGPILEYLILLKRYSLPNARYKFKNKRFARRSQSI